VFAFPEAEVMRDLAIGLGVPRSAILLETSGGNTHEGVVEVTAQLRSHGWRRVLFVSSPYNMRRALGVWHKQAPEVDVVPTPPPATQFYAHADGTTLTQVRGLLQEYAALVWYWWKGWL
jgi:uncharacterized SAM-binding protein YcdF (DUF218 family)